MAGRIDARLKELGITLRYPDYKAGLRAIFEVETGATDSGADRDNLDISE